MIGWSWYLAPAKPTTTYIIIDITKKEDQAMLPQNFLAVKLQREVFHITSHYLCVVYDDYVHLTRLHEVSAWRFEPLCLSRELDVIWWSPSVILNTDLCNACKVDGG